jgi:hypothetical protein
VASAAVRTNAMPTVRIVTSPELFWVSIRAQRANDKTIFQIGTILTLSYKNSSKMMIHCQGGLLIEDLSVNTGVLELL